MAPYRSQRPRTKMIDPDPYPDRQTLLRILDHMYDELYVINSQGTCIYVNKACERHYGISPLEIIGQKVWESTQKGYWFPPIGPIVLRNKKTATYEQRTNTGKLMLVTATPVLNDKGKVEMVVENLREISKLDQVKTDLAHTRKLLARYKKEVKQLRSKHFSGQGQIVAKSKAMENTLELANRVAQVDSTVLITGKTGTGKGLLARHLHESSPRKENPFITVNCAAIPEQLFESELFGYQSGAFTGASAKGKAGLFSLAGGGTLFLDEIAEIPSQLQAKLLHVLQEKRFLAVGSNSYEKIDCRILVGTNQNLRSLVDKGLFREDLFYRLNTIEIEIPTLRQRPEDIVPLLQHFLNKYNLKFAKDHYFTAEALDILSHHNWPGNVRELEHLVERVVVTAPSPAIGPESLPVSVLPAENLAPDWSPQQAQNLDQALEQVEKTLVQKAKQAHGSSYKVAKALGISQSKAYRLIQKHCTGQPS